ncbi:MAG TPA: ATP-binding protein [Stellaceae bacterium]|nr:ATP-binding protein [Stellaceae bacterium]
MRSCTEKSAGRDGMEPPSPTADASRDPGRPARLLDRAVVRYALGVAFVAAAVLVSFPIEKLTGSVSTFPFYAAVVGSAWLGLGPGIVSLILSALAVDDLWNPPLFSLRMDLAELPSFAAFLCFAVMSLAWSAQRRRAESGLENTVRARTADLLRANNALQNEIAERKAAEEERRRTEQALRDAEAELARTLRLATLAELAAAIAHEINQPLAAIAANGSACLRSLGHRPPMLENAREAAACVVEDSHRAGDVIARIRALFNKEEPKRQRLDINLLVQHVLEISRGAIERQRVAARLEPAAPAPVVLGDPVQLQQVLVNLVTNALEAMAAVSDGPRRLTIRTALDGDEAVVSVADSGPGLMPGEASQIFDSFYTTKPDGIGVGLAISRSIVEAHGGTLWVAPAPGLGAEIAFRLPAAPAVPGRHHASAAAAIGTKC